MVPPGAADFNPMKETIIQFLAGVGACAVILLIGAWFIKMLTKEANDFFDPKD